MSSVLVLSVTLTTHLRQTYYTHTQPFCNPFSRTTRVGRCPKKSSSGLYGARGDIKGRHTDNPARRHSIRTNQRPISLIPLLLCRMPFLSQPSHFILAWDRHQICWLAYPMTNLLTTPHHSRFTALFPGPRRWAGARRELLDFMVQGTINRGRHTDHPAGRHSIRTNQCPPPPSPIFYRPDALPAAQPIVPKHWRQLAHSD